MAFEDPFFAWDGEGYNENGEHRYWLLANSKGECTEDFGGLSTYVAFEALLAGATYWRGHNHVAFVSSYDVNMLLRDCLPSLSSIHQGEFTTVWLAGPSGIARKYRVHYLPRKKFWLADDKGRSITLFDVFGFFQTSFVGALEEYLGKDYAPLQRIRELKAQRSQFARADAERVKAYCLSECTELVILCNALRDALRMADLPVRSWIGAGAVAGELLRREGAKNHLTELPWYMREPVAKAYSGGRIEITHIGHTYEATVYDIVSAYPAAMTELPCLHGRWEPMSVTGWDWLEGAKSEFPLMLHEVIYEGPPDFPWYPLFHRDSLGSIRYPRIVHGVYWTPEIDLARAHCQKYGGTLTPRKSWAFTNDYGHKSCAPFAFVPRIFETRAAYKKAGNAAEKALKLGLNSLYGALAPLPPCILDYDVHSGASARGKMAQQVSWRNTVAPTFFSLAWAGYVTSRTRMRLGMLALGFEPDEILMFATDGLFVNGTHEPLTPSGLGTWESKRVLNLVVVQAGVYWYQKEGMDAEVWAHRSRGFDKGTMRDPTLAFEAWSKGVRSVDIPSTRFVTLGAALQGKDPAKTWRQWLTTPRTLDLTGASEKRMGALRLPLADKACAPGLVPLDHAMQNLWGLMEPSHAYPVAFWKDIPAAGGIDEGEVQDLLAADDAENA